MKILRTAVDISRKHLTRLPLTSDGTPLFGGIRISRSFNCSFNRITSLAGSPKYVNGDFSCVVNLLTSLVGAPKYVGGHFDCRFNQLENLEGAPEEVGGDFICSHNPLISLDGCPEVVEGDFYCNATARSFTEAEIREKCRVGRNVIVD